MRSSEVIEISSSVNSSIILCSKNTELFEVFIDGEGYFFPDLFNQSDLIELGFSFLKYSFSSGNLTE